MFHKEYSVKPKKDFPAEVYLNGQWVRSEDAMISVFDRGFMFGDGIYEVTPFYSGKPFRAEAHLDRLEYCLNQIGLQQDIEPYAELMNEAIQRTGLEDKDAGVYIQISRGVAPRTHWFPENSRPTVLLYAFPVDLEHFEQKRWSALVSKDYRWQRCDIKSTALLANCMANDSAISAGYDEHLLVRDSCITEGSHSTAFFVSDGVVHTHPEGPLILSGITRKEVLDICKQLGIPVRTQAVRLQDLSRMEEVFFTGTTTQITSVSLLEGKGIPTLEFPRGEITAKLQEEFRRRTRGTG